ncbi:hypothetical protein ACROYT_G019163 [Oculina patagonica]
MSTWTESDGFGRQRDEVCAYLKGKYHKGENKQATKTAEENHRQQVYRLIMRQDPLSIQQLERHICCAKYTTSRKRA